MSTRSVTQTDKVTARSSLRKPFHEFEWMWLSDGFHGIYSRVGGFGASGVPGDPADTTQIVRIFSPSGLRVPCAHLQS